MNINKIWFLCITIRFLLGCVVWIQPADKTVTVDLLSVLLLFIGIGFFYKALTGSNNETQISKVFWHNSRGLHGGFYTIASVLLFTGYPRLSASFIFLDLLFSILYRIITNQ